MCGIFDKRTCYIRDDERLDEILLNNDEDIDDFEDIDDYDEMIKHEKEMLYVDMVERLVQEDNKRAINKLINTDKPLRKILFEEKIEKLKRLILLNDNIINETTILKQRLINKLSNMENRTLIEVMNKR